MGKTVTASLYALCDISVVEDHGGLEPYQFKLLAPANAWCWAEHVMCAGPFVEWLLHYTSTIINKSLSGNRTLHERRIDVTLED